MNLRDFRIWEVKIEDIIPDGTVVDSGEYIASLDRTELVNKMKDQELEIEKLQTQFTKTQLDTTLELRSTRDNLVNLKYALEEKQIVVDQSIYEPPATQRQARIELERAQRNYEQAVENYAVKLKKAEADMQEINTSMKKVQSDYSKMLKVLNDFTIYAPKSGMVIYRRDWEGQKQGIGSTISVWDPVVAELPNLKEMKSKTYVNEIDISKVKVNQEVLIGVDAFPDRKFTGKVMEVANIGQQLPNSNAKVFEVSIEINQFDSILRPAMTTKNEILTASIDSVLFIPLDCVQSNDSLTFVYSGNYRKQVILGLSNDNEVIAKAGLEAGDEVYLVPPSDAGDYKLIRLEKDILEKFSNENESKELIESRDSLEINKMEMKGDMPRKGKQGMQKMDRPPVRR
jgi:hypothetical protein